MIARSHTLPVTRQAQQLGVSRGSVYYVARPVSAAGLAVIRRIDELHMDYPFAGSRMLRDLLGRRGIEIGRLHVATYKEDGDRGDLSAAEHVEADAGPRGLSLSAA